MLRDDYAAQFQEYVDISPLGSNAGGFMVMLQQVTEIST